MSIILFVLAILVLAAVLILWKPSVRTKYTFIRLSIGNLLIHLMDGFITYANTPDLKREGNPLVSKLGLGWGALFTSNLIFFLLLVLMTWYAYRYEHIKIPSKSPFDYFMKLMHGENYKPIWFWYKFTKNYRSTVAFVGYSLYWGLTAGAPAFVFGWIWYMLGFDFWWNSTLIAFAISLVVAFLAMYKWAKEGYQLSLSE